MRIIIHAGGVCSSFWERARSVIDFFNTIGKFHIIRESPQIRAGRVAKVHCKMNRESDPACPSETEQMVCQFSGLYADFWHCGRFKQLSATRRPERE